MSSICFASPSGSVYLRGSERAYMARRCEAVACGFFDPQGTPDDPLFKVTTFRKDNYTVLGGGLLFQRDFSNALTLGNRKIFHIPGVPEDKQPDAFCVPLNTCLAVGNDALCLMARLHGQCEIHAWVDGPNRAWLADIIKAGRAVKLLRDNQNWEGVEEFLRASATEPVVTSYSVTESFPNPYVANFDLGEDGEDYDSWEALSKEQQWELAMKGLCADPGFEMRPDQWRMPDFFFGYGETAFTILEAAHKCAAEEAKGKTP